MSMLTDIYGGFAKAAQYRGEANAAEYNAAVAAQDADTALQAGNANEEAQRRKSAVEMGRLRAGMAESGIGLNSGTASDLVEQSAMNAELDALNTRYQGTMQARGYKAQSALNKQQAAMARNNATSAIVSGFMNAGARALTAGAKYSGGGA